MSASDPATAYVALGSNLGDRRAHLEAAFSALACLPDTRLLARSSIFETPPFGPPGQQDYLNAVAALSTRLSPHALLDALLAIEQSRGRVRRERWGSRTLDLDLLLHGDTSLKDARLTLPHPSMLGRAFVLTPLCELAPDLVLSGRPLAWHLAQLDQTGIRRLRDQTSRPDSAMDPLDTLQARLGHVFARPELLREAFAHPSYVNEHPEAGPSNQRLEFLGDAVLQLIVTDALYALFPAEPEGALSRRRSILTKGRCLAQLALELGIDSTLRLGGSENTPVGRIRPSNLEDAFEALVGALYLDAGIERTRALVLATYGPLGARLAAGSLVDNPKGRLQELVQPTHGSGALRYETTHSAGPDHDREYTSRIHLGDCLVAEGRGPSKKAAEEAAARIALEERLQAGETAARSPA